MIKVVESYDNRIKRRIDEVLNELKSIGENNYGACISTCSVDMYSKIPVKKLFSEKTVDKLRTVLIFDVDLNRITARHKRFLKLAKTIGEKLGFDEVVMDYK